MRRRGWPHRFSLSPVQASLSVLLIVLNTDGYFFPVLFAALIHEAGHLIAAALLGLEVDRMSLGLMGARIVLRGEGSYLQDAAVAFWGAGANLLCLFPAWLWIRRTGGVAAIFFFFCSLTLALVNLLPAEGLDGGLILHSLAARFLDLTRADALLGVFSRLTAGFLGALALILWRTVGNLSLCVVCAALFFRLWAGEEK